MKFKLECLLAPMIAISLLLALINAGTCLQVTGIIVEGDYPPGGHISHQLFVNSDKNESPMDLRVDAFDVAQSTEGIAQAIERNSEAEAYSAKSYFKISPSSFHLNPGESATVQVDGDIPNDAAPGGKYAIIQVHSMPQNSSDIKKSGVSILSAINTLVRITITGGTLQETGEISNMKIEAENSDQLNLNMSFKNMGNIHYHVIADVFLKNAEGTVLGNMSQASGSNIFPTATRIFKLSLKPNEKLAPGKYTISSTVSLEDGTVLASKDKEFEIKN